MIKISFIVVLVIMILVILIFLLKDKKNKVKINIYNPKKNMLLKNKDSHITKNFEEQLEIQNELAGITEIILSNNLGQQLSFYRLNEVTEFKYQEVFLSEGSAMVGRVIEGAMPVLGRSNTLEELEKMAPKGLFAATVDPSKLSKFKDGTTSTMVRDINNNLTSHAGYKRVSIEKFDPLTLVNAGMQASAAITGQYYLNQIFNQLEGINSNLEKLIEFHHDEKIGKLRNSKNRLSEIINRSSVDYIDINEIRNLRNIVGEVFCEYKRRLDKEQKNIIDSNFKEWLMQDRVKEYCKMIDEINFTLEVCFESDKLCLLAEVAEISLRKKLDFKDIIIEDLFNQLKGNYDSSFSIKLNENIKEIFEPINLKANRMIEDTKVFPSTKKNREKLLERIYIKTNMIEQKLDQNLCDNTVNEFCSTEFDEQEVLIMPGEYVEEQRVFIPVIEL